MKQFLGTRISVLDDAPVINGIVRRAGIEQLQEARAVRTQARLKAARILQEARRERDEAHREAEAILQAARAQATQEAGEIAAQARARAVGDAVEWLVDLSDLENTVAHGLEGRLRELVAQAVGAVLGECDTGTLLAQRIANRMSQMNLVEPVELRVEASAVAKVMELFAGRPEVTVVVDPALSEHQATLHSGLMAIHFDVCQHLEQVLASLRLQPKTEGG